MTDDVILDLPAGTPDIWRRHIRRTFQKADDLLERGRRTGDTVMTDAGQKALDRAIKYVRARGGRAGVKAGELKFDVGKPKDVQHPRTMAFESKRYPLRGAYKNGK